MARIVSATRYPETQEIEYVTDDFARLVHNTRTGEWTLFRLPTPTDLLEIAEYAKRDFVSPLRTPPRITDLAAYTAPIRVTPTVLADAPRHAAEVEDETDD